MDLSSYDNESLKQFVQDNLDRDPAHLLLSHRGKTSFDLKLAIQQIYARQRLQDKVPSWAKNEDLIFPSGLSLEQASSEVTARYKASLVQANTLIDLTGGLGVDTFFLSQSFAQTDYVEKLPELAELATHNFSHLAPESIRVHTGDGLAFLAGCVEKYDLIYLDPARRGEHNRKLVRLEDCEPNLVVNWSELTQKGNAILAKVSPMLDIKGALASLPDIQQVWVLAHKNEVKELLFFWEAGKSVSSPNIHCVDIHPEETHTYSFTYPEEEAVLAEYGEAGEFLIEPHAAILKAGAFRSFARRFDLRKLHPNSHLYSGTSVIDDLPGRVFRILQEIRQPKRELKELFPSGIVNVITRNYALRAEDLKKKYRLRDGGNQFLIGTRSEAGFRLFVCELVASGERRKGG
ncbi:SAM-dependent methyltransferase [Lunatimonas lonarensis]|uniref:SAM-dependent methyltransferase n=1 Tax=Lunatimonas lonarensis TaxID=1232681 RepID=R7ZMD9_9BACT|nr:SAM-dependent methyltransferase [Lunatimonas lonarensis]